MFLLSLHDIYFQRFLSGEKLFEFRKRIPAGLKSGDELAIYCTKPTCMIVGYAEIGGVLEDEPSKLWERTKFAAGIDKTAFVDYFRNSKKAYALIIRKVYKLSEPISLSTLRGKASAPQSFIYLTDSQTQRIKCATRECLNAGISLFIGGVHGVGKTTFCQNFLAPLGFDCVSASSLIRRHISMSVADKRVKNVSGNQSVLIAESEKEASKTRLYGLDGHYCLLNNDGLIDRLPIEIFEALKIDLFLLIDDDIDAVQKRLKRRDGTKWTKKNVGTMMRAERVHAKRVAKKLLSRLIILKKESPAVIRKKIIEALSDFIAPRRLTERYNDPRLK